MEANLLTFTVTLQQDGELRSNLVYIDPKTLVTTLDELNPEYPNTHILAAILRNYIRELEYIQKYIDKLIGTL